MYRKKIIKNCFLTFLVGTMSISPVFAGTTSIDAPVDNAENDYTETQKAEQYKGILDTGTALENIAGEKLRVYGIIPEIGDINRTLTMSECIDMMNSLMLLRSENYNEVASNITTEQKVFSMYLFGMIDNNTEIYNNDPVKYSDFVTYVMKFLGYSNKTSYVSIAENNGITKYTDTKNSGRDITIGEAYMILNNAISGKYQGGKSVIDSLVNINVDTRYTIPETISIKVSSLEDMKNKLYKALEYCPSAITIDMSDLSNNVKKEIYKYLLDTHYEWVYNMGDDFDFADYFNPNESVMFLPEYKTESSYSDTKTDTPELEKANNILDFEKMLNDTGIDIIRLDTENMYEHKYLNFGIKNDWAWGVVQNPTLEESLKKFVNEKLVNVENLDTMTKINAIRTSINNYVSYTSEKSETSNSLNGFVEGGKLSSEGYAKAFAWLCDYFDIDCIIVSGYDPYNPTEIHYWNQVKVNGEWLNVDMGMENKLGKSSMFFLKDNNSFEANRHIRLEDATGPYFEN